MKDTEKLLSVRQAASMGIERLRQPTWANPLDHVKIDIIDGEPGPWLHLFAPFNKECNGRDPVDILWPLGTAGVSVDAEGMVPYDGPLPDSDEYRAAVQRYAGTLGDANKSDTSGITKDKATTGENAAVANPLETK